LYVDSLSKGTKDRHQLSATRLLFHRALNKIRE
jgi:hypothetical protein